MKNNKLSIASRILVAFASGALIVVFFLPAWRIDLFAPQYPEGLTMNIWINGLSGDVDIINGLNHYIGMKHITVGMFPEFRYLPYVVGFFMLLGLLVAVTGNRKFLLAYISLTAIGGALAMYDFYKWGYDYGHNLDPTAPIQVEGLSYQPPLIGHKRLLNFDAYSFPHVGGWVVIGAAVLAFVVWFVEWYRHRTITKKHPIAAIGMPALFLMVLFSSCSIKPEPFVYGKDVCYTCKMGIIDPKFGGEIITKKGKIFKFDDQICMANYLKSGVLEEAEIKQKLVLNFEKQNDFLDVAQCFLVVSDNIKSPMTGNAGAFADRKSAEAFNNAVNGKILSWQEFSDQLK
ncbi:MAG: nitrous oxide reductase accessory protein NosL [Chitinophagaceae bacterium]